MFRIHFTARKQLQKKNKVPGNCYNNLWTSLIFLHPEGIKLPPLGMATALRFTVCWGVSVMSSGPSCVLPGSWWGLLLCKHQPPGVSRTGAACASCRGWNMIWRLTLKWEISYLRLAVYVYMPLRYRGSICTGFDASEIISMFIVVVPPWSTH